MIDDFHPESGESQSLRRLSETDLRVHRVGNSSSSLGFASLGNRGLLARDRDAVLLSPDCIVGRDWLAELGTVAHSEERTACVSPLINAAGTCSVTGPNRPSMPGTLDESTVHLACEGLPRWTIAPILSHYCIYLRGDAIDAVGLMDPTIVSAREAVEDWVMRAQTLGFMAKRANHAYVHLGSRHATYASMAGKAESDPAHHSRQPHLEHQLRKFQRSLDGHLAGHAIQIEATGKLRLAYDIRHLPREHVGTRTYAISLARALAGIPDIDLTLLVADPAQAHGLKGRVVTEDRWEDDVSVIHKPSRVLSPLELRLLFGSSAHVIVTYQDLIGYRIPLAFPSDAEFDEYRATSSLSLQAVQKIIAISENVAEEIHAEFGVPREDIPIVAHGVESEWFAHRGERDVAIGWRMGLSDRYFLSLATDFPHKNLSNLLDAYALLRSRWRDGEPPDLVLAGHASGARTGFYRNLKNNTFAKGLRVLGAVSHEELRVLYQNAECLVYPSLYEGFGLPPLEAMAAGTPVIAMPFSAVPEVVGDCALLPDGLSTNALARAMEAFASDAKLREEFRARGLKRVEMFRWENTARRTYASYRSAVSRPSERSLRMRAHLREAILRWGHTVPTGLPAVEPMGILNSINALQSAIQTRLARETKRFRSRGRRHPVQTSPTSLPPMPAAQETSSPEARSRIRHHFSSHFGRLLRFEGRSQTKGHEEHSNRQSETAAVGIRTSRSRPKI